MPVTGDFGKIQHFSSFVLGSIGRSKGDHTQGCIRITLTTILNIEVMSLFCGEAVIVVEVKQGDVRRIKAGLVAGIERNHKRDCIKDGSGNGSQAGDIDLGQMFDAEIGEASEKKYFNG